MRRWGAFYYLRFRLITRIGPPQVFETENINRFCDPRKIPAEYRQVIARLELEGLTDFEKAKRIAFDLSYGHPRGAGLGCDSVTALHSIYHLGEGVCSDYAQVFTGLCLAADLKVREWGLCDDFVDIKIGHSFCEVWCKELQEWVFIDPSRSVYALDTLDGSLLSATRLIDLSTSGQKERVLLKQIDSTYKLPTGRIFGGIYHNGENIFFLLSQNAIFRQDPILSLRFFPLIVRHGLLYLMGEYYRYEIYANSANRSLMEDKLRKLQNFSRKGPPGAPPTVAFPYPLKASPGGREEMRQEASPRNPG